MGALSSIAALLPGMAAAPGRASVGTTGATSPTGAGTSREVESFAGLLRTTARAIAAPASVVLAEAGLAATRQLGGSNALGGMPAALAVAGALTALDGTPPAPDRVAGLQQAGYEVVDDAALPGGADAAYDGGSRSIGLRSSVASQGLAASSRLLMDRLLDGALGSAGKASAGAAEQASAQDRHDLAATVALVAHENVHAGQELAGPAGAGAAAGAAVILPDGSVDPVALRDHVRQVELPAQVVQEQTQAAYGAAPRTTSYQTIDARGVPLPADQAVENIIAQRGPSIVAGLQADSQLDPGKRFPGKRFPGKRFPGALAT
jgi:hypothetical protein